MMSITLEEARARLPQLIDGLKPGEEVVITRNNEAVAKLVGQSRSERRPRKPGSAHDKILHMSDDFDAPLDDFQKYMR
jgi:prevent-host-death family protein